MKVKPTRTDAAGNGYYRGTDGKFYYGNVKNGYLKETIEERNRRIAKEQNKQKTVNSSVKQGSTSTLASAAVGSAGGGLLGGIAAFLGMLAAFAVTAAIMGPIIVIGTILGLIVAMIGLVVTWVKQYGIIYETLSVYGVNWTTILIVLPMILTLVVFFICMIKTVVKHKLYVPHLLISYMILFLPYSFIQVGGIQAFQQGIMRFSNMLMTDLNFAFVNGFVPMIVLFIFHWMDKKVQNEQSKKNRETMPPKSEHRLTRFCTGCGARVEASDATFCGKCGTRLN